MRPARSAKLDDTHAHVQASHPFIWSLKQGRFQLSGFNDKTA